MQPWIVQRHDHESSGKSVSTSTMSQCRPGLQRRGLLTRQEYHRHSAKIRVNKPPTIPLFRLQLLSLLQPATRYSTAHSRHPPEDPEHSWIISLSYSGLRIYGTVLQEIGVPPPGVSCITKYASFGLLSSSTPSHRRNRTISERLSHYHQNTHEIQLGRERQP